MCIWILRFQNVCNVQVIINWTFVVQFWSGIKLVILRSLQSEWLSLMQFIYESHHFPLKIASFPSQWGTLLKTQLPIRFLGSFIKTNNMRGKWKITMATLYKPAQYWINELFLQNKKSCVLRFQNRWTELVIELSVEAFWSESYQIRGKITECWLTEIEGIFLNHEGTFGS